MASMSECCICGNYKKGEFIILNDKKYHIECIEILQQENQRLKEEIKDLECIVGIRQKRNLISKFDKEYDEEDKKRNPNRDYTIISPDAEEVYKRYYEQKEQLKQRKEVIDEAINTIESWNFSLSSAENDRLKIIIGILTKYKGDSNE